MQSSAQSVNSLDSLQIVEKVEIFISCRKLKNMDVLSLSDPVVRCHTESAGKWAFFDVTEMIKDNLNPNFAKSFVMEFHFELKQKLRFEILDVDGPNQFDYIGEVFTTLGDLVGAKNQTSIFDIKNKEEKTGKLILRCEKVRECNETLFLELCANKLLKGGWFSSTNPFLRFYRSREDGAWVLVHQTESVKKSTTPRWKAFTVSVQKLANGDHYRPIKLECVSQNGMDEKVIGETTFNVEDIVNEGKREFNLKSAKNKECGSVTFNQVSLTIKPNFLDYIRGGTQLAVACAIDFTGSNGIPTAPTSLHAMKIDGSLNEYQRAIQGVCDILLSYDYDKMVPVYGFGGKPCYPTLRSNQTMHCFPCTGIPGQADVYGLQGIMDSYAYSLKNVELSGPTLFAPLITETMKVVQQNKAEGSQVYTILLILTDGEIHDMENTINCLIQSAKLPLSIIIVGIGSADFEKMEILDGDEGLYNSNGVKAPRDLVQFVPFRKFSGSQEALAREVLHEIPDQVVEYMQSMGINPNPPKQVDYNAVYARMGTMPEGPIDYQRGGTMPNEAMIQVTDERMQQEQQAPTDSVFQRMNHQAQYNSNIMRMGHNLVGQQLQNMNIQGNGVIPQSGPYGGPQNFGGINPQAGAAGGYQDYGRSSSNSVTLNAFGPKYP